MRLGRRGSGSLLLALALLAVAAGALSSDGRSGRAPGSLTFTPVADAYVRSDAPRRNFGTRTELRTRGGKPAFRSYLKFIVRGAGTVYSARLRLYVEGSSRSAGTVYRASRDGWKESRITYVTAPGVAGGTLDTEGIATAGTWVEFDVTPAVPRDGTYSFVIASTVSNAVVYASRERAARRPQLVVSTSPPDGTTVTAMAAGDIACAPGARETASACHQRQTSDILLASPLDAVLALGDLQYDCGAASGFRESYDPTWGRLKSVTHPAPGNHEYGTNGADCDPAGQAAGYFGYFGAAAGDPGKGYYSFDVGAWHVIALNSNCSSAGGCGAGSPQEAWLRTDLAAHPAACTLAFWHYPRFSSGVHGNITATKAFWSDLYESGADLVLSGHDHDYERFAPQTPDGVADAARGIREFVVGTGGKGFRSFPAAPEANSEARQADTFGVLKLSLRPSGYGWEFVPEAGGTFADSGSASCH